MRFKPLMLAAMAMSILTGCDALRNPAFGAAMMQGSANYSQQVNQQIYQQQQNFAAQNAENERLREQQELLKATQEAQGRSIYNSATGRYQYVPPGWKAVWDSNQRTWIIQP